MGLQEAQVLRQHSRAFAVSPSQELGGEDLFIHSGLRSSCLLPELLQPPPCVPHLPGYSLATQGWPSDWRVDAGPSRAPPGPFPRLRLVPVRIGQRLCTQQGFLSICRVWTPVWRGGRSSAGDKAWGREWRKRGQQEGRKGRRSWAEGPGAGRPWPGRLGAVPWGAGGWGRAHVEPCTSFVLLQDYYYLSVKSLYTVGYSTSLVTLTTAMVILCRFR